MHQKTVSLKTVFEQKHLIKGKYKCNCKLLAKLTNQYRRNVVKSNFWCSITDITSQQLKMAHNENKHLPLTEEKSVLELVLLNECSNLNWPKTDNKMEYYGLLWMALNGTGEVEGSRSHGCINFYIGYKIKTSGVHQEIQAKWFWLRNSFSLSTLPRRGPKHEGSNYLPCHCTESSSYLGSHPSNKSVGEDHIFVITINLSLDNGTKTGMQVLKQYKKISIYRNIVYCMTSVM